MTGFLWRREFIQFKRGVRSIMVGRPRKIGRRKPGGRLAQAYINPKAQVATQPHRASVGKTMREWPEAGSPFGRLMLNGKITPAQYEAGVAYADLAASYRAVFDVPRIHPAGMDLASLGRSVGAGIDPSAARVIRRRYDAAFEAIGANRLQRAVKDAAVMEKPVHGDFHLDLLKRGLDRLVDHFRIDSKLQIVSRAKCRV